MNQVAIKEEMNFDLILKDVETMQKMCASLMKSKHYQAMGEAGLFAIVQKAKSLNIHPLEALNGGLYYVQGKVGMSTEMMACLIRQAGHSITKDSKSDNTVCILHGKRADTGDSWTVSFSIEDARRAGLLKNMYEKYPGIMLYNRAMSMLARQLFPDIIKGAGYTNDELREIAESKRESFPEPILETVEVISEKINAEQFLELSNIFSLCDPGYLEKVFKTLTELGVKELEDLPLSLYERIKKAALKNKEEYQLKINESGDSALVA